MKSLANIIDETKDGGSPLYEELYYALIAVESLRILDNMALLRLGYNKETIVNNAKCQAEESFRRTKNCMEKDPKSWLGWNNDPKNDEYQKQRSINKKIMNKVMSDTE